MVGDLWQGIHGERPVGRSLLDVGGGPGYFAAAFADAGVRYIGVEPDPSEMHAAGGVLARETATFVRASGMALPFADNSVDICLSSNVAEHVPRPWQLGGARAAARYARKHGHPAKNNYGSSLFAVSAADGLDWAASTGALISAFPRYHPKWAWRLTAIPVVREFLVSNLVLVLRPQ